MLAVLAMLHANQTSESYSHKNLATSLLAELPALLMHTNMHIHFLV